MADPNSTPHVPAGGPASGPAIVTVEQMRELERLAEAAGSPPERLLANAGLAVADWLDHASAVWWATRAPAAGEPPPGRRVLGLIGPGNNGGDGLVALAHLARRGWQTSAALWQRRREPDWPLEAARAAGVTLWEAAESTDRLVAELAGGPWVLDALFGIGHSRPFAGPLADLLRTVVRHAPAGRVVALDIPSGVNGDTGEADPLTPPADATLALSQPKVGLLRFPAAGLTGDLITLPIGIPEALSAANPLRLISDEWAGALLPERPRDANKGTFGRVAVVAGSVSYPGAAALTTAAAVRSGAGLVTLAVEAAVRASVAAHVTETTFLDLPAGPDMAAPAHALLDAIRGYTTLLIGPGLGQGPGRRELVETLLPGWNALGRAAVIDADALNALAERPDWPALLARPNVLTPHPGEMARLMGGGLDPHAVDRDRLMVAPDRARAWGQIVVLKGAHTVVAAPDGRAAVSPVATPALATAGSGDVLAGTIAGLMAQGLDGWAAAVAGVMVHARAGQLVARELGEAGAAAGDLLPKLPLAQRALRAASGSGRRRFDAGNADR